MICKNPRDQQSRGFQVSGPGGNRTPDTLIKSLGWYLGTTRHIGLKPSEYAVYAGLAYSRDSGRVVTTRELP